MIFNQFSNFNLRYFQIINNLVGRSKILDGLGIFFAKYLLYIILVALFVFFVYSFLRKKYLGLSFLIIFSVVLASGIVVPLLRRLFPHPRPFVILNVHLLLSHAPTNSFPSGHTIFLFAISFAVFLYAFKKNLSKKEKNSFFWIGIILLLLSSLCGIARIFCGVHWPFDIIGGAVFGIFSAAIVWWLGRKLIS